MASDSNELTDFHHITVLPDEPIEFITENFEPEKSYVVMDGTFGGGGHSLRLLKSHSGIRVVAFDQDPDAIANGKKLIQEQNLEDRLTLHQSNFSHFNDFLEGQKIDGAILDIGVSSHQFDQKSRGFSFQEDAFLNMRMDQDESKLTAFKIINEYTEEDLCFIFSNYGEERFSKRIANEIVEARSKEVIKSTKELENIIFHCYPKKQRFGKTHPATRCFQALRIEANQELEVLKSSIPLLFDHMNIGARAAIICFHSLEDRIVKQGFRALKDSGEIDILTKRPLVPTDEEILNNKRARSAKMRVAQKK